MSSLVRKACTPMISKNVGKYGLTSMVHKLRFSSVMQAPLAKEIFNETSKPINEARTLLPESYHKQEYFDIEMEQIFGNEWFGVGHVSGIHIHNKKARVFI